MKVIHRFVVQRDSDGGSVVHPHKKHVRPGDRVWWLPATSTEKVDIEFIEGITPLHWLRKKERPGRTVKGTVRRNSVTGGYIYLLPNMGIRAQPELIVDGGLTPKGATKRTGAAKAKRAAKKR